MCLKRNIWILEREAQINKIEIGKSAAVATKAQKELDTTKFEAALGARLKPNVVPAKLF